MEKTTIKTIFTMIFFMLNIHVKAQDTIVARDIELWSGISVEKKLLDGKLNLNFSQELRFNNNISSVNIYFTEAGIEYEFMKNLKAGFGYRFIKNRNNENLYINKQRFNFDLDYIKIIQRIKLYGRFRYQRTSEYNSQSEAFNKYRIRLRGKYNIKNWKLDPYLSSEIFIADKRDYFFKELPDKKGIEKIRFTIGSSYKIKNAGTLKMFYRIEHERGKFSNIYNIPANIYIIGLSFNYNL